MVVEFQSGLKPACRAELVLIPAALWAVITCSSLGSHRADGLEAYRSCRLYFVPSEGPRTRCRRHLQDLGRGVGTGTADRGLSPAPGGGGTILRYFRESYPSLRGGTRETSLRHHAPEGELGRIGEAVSAPVRPRASDRCLPLVVVGAFLFVSDGPRLMYVPRRHEETEHRIGELRAHGLGQGSVQGSEAHPCGGDQQSKRPDSKAEVNRGWKALDTFYDILCASSSFSRQVNPTTESSSKQEQRYAEPSKRHKLRHRHHQPRAPAARPSSREPFESLDTILAAPNPRNLANIGSRTLPHDEVNVLALTSRRATRLPPTPAHTTHPSLLNSRLFPDHIRPVREAPASGGITEITRVQLPRLPFLGAEGC